MNISDKKNGFQGNNTINQEEYSRLKSWEERYQVIFDESPFILVLNELNSGKYIDVNHHFCAENNLIKEDCLGKTSTELGFITDYTTDELRQKLIHDGKLENYEFEFINRHGEQRIYLQWTQIVEINGEKVAFTTLKDTTERKKDFAEMMESREQLRALASHLQNIREEERIHIAREIHDELGHILTAIKLDLEDMTMLSNDGGRSFQESIPPLLSLVDSCIDSVREIAVDLRPGLLDHFGLIAALEWMIQQFQLRNNIQCQHDFCSDTFPFTKEESTVIFRIFQEIFTNISRHSNAKNVSVTLQQKNHQIIFHIIDDGQGFNPDQISKITSLGLLGMKERALSVGAELQIASEPGKGTSIDIILASRQSNQE